MKKLCLITAFVQLLAYLVFPQGKSSIQFTGGTVNPMSSSSGLSGAFQYNYNINPRFNLFVSTDYSVWDKRYYIFYPNTIIHNDPLRSYPESDHSLSRIMAGGRYIIIEPAKFQLFVEGGIGYSYLKYKSYDMQLVNTPDGGQEILYSVGTNESENLFNISTGIGFIHQMTTNWDVLLEFKMNTYLNSHYYGIFSSRGTFTGFNGGFNYRI